MTANQQSFDDLEKQLARDALEQALKDLHSVINKEIENNKEGFSKESTLKNTFREAVAPTVCCVDPQRCGKG